MLGHRDVALCHAVQEGDRVLVGAERRTALEHRVERRPEREHVGGEAGRFAARHLGCQVGGRAVHEPGRGDRGVAERLRDAEVADQRRPVLADQDVARLHVAVHDAPAVRGGECRADLGADARGLLRREGAVLLQQRRQRRRLDELHDDARLALVLDDVEHRHGVRMVQAGADPRLAHGPLGGDLAFLVGELRLGAQQLQGDGALEALVPRVPDDAHAAAADQLHEAIAVGDQGGRRVHRGLPCGTTPTVPPSGVRSRGLAATEPVWEGPPAGRRWAAPGGAGR
ncbi:hypothetical protein AVP42_02901 [Agromyces sp. NDB4Y10]|nr:hypothetical protein AVP42_02901 [Agromyces sp. NDB4Y10]